MHPVYDAGHCDGLAVATQRSLWRPTITKLAWGASPLGVILALTGCAQFSTEPSTAFCSSFESAWNDFASVRSEPATNRAETLSARDELRARWEAPGDSDEPSDLTAILSTIDADFVGAWNSTTAGERRGRQDSWQNGMDYVAGRCADGGAMIELDSLDTELLPPK